VSIDGPTCGDTAATPTAGTTVNVGLRGLSGDVSDATLKTVTDLPLPGGATRFDYQSLDPTTGRLFIAHMGDGQIVVIDLSTQTVAGTVDDLPTVTGVLAIPELGRVYASVAGSHQVAIVDAGSLNVVARIGAIGFPDGLDYAPNAGRVFVSDENGGGELVIDVASETVVGTVDIGGKAGNTHFDPGTGCIVVAVQDRNELVFLDPFAGATVRHVAMPGGCDGPHGFLIEDATRKALVTCEDSAQLIVLDLTTFEATANYPVGDGPDVLAFDPVLARLYVASESGVVSLFQEGAGGLELLGQLSMPHAHSVAVDPGTHLVYVPLENVDGRPVLRIMAPAPAGSSD
jgi:DNA-binding beta-propeller fold protein YncE